MSCGREIALLRRLAAMVAASFLLEKIPTPIKTKLALPPPLLKKPNTPPLKGGILWAWGFSSRKNPQMPGAHKIGAAISGPRITGGNFMDITLVLTCDHLRVARKSLAASNFFFCGRRSENPCDFCSGMLASPLAATVVIAILRCDFCAAKEPVHAKGVVLCERTKRLL